MQKFADYEGENVLKSAKICVTPSQLTSLVAIQRLQCYLCHFGNHGIVQHAVSAGRLMAKVIDQRRCLGESLLNVRRSLDENGGHTPGNGNRALSNIQVGVQRSTTHTHSIVKQDAAESALAHVHGTDDHGHWSVAILLLGLHAELLQCRMTVDVLHHWRLLGDVAHVHFAGDVEYTALVREDGHLGAHAELVLLFLHQLRAEQLRKSTDQLKSTI